MFPRARHIGDDEARWRVRRQQIRARAWPRRLQPPNGHDQPGRHRDKEKFAPSGLHEPRTFLRPSATVKPFSGVPLDLAEAAS